MTPNEPQIPHLNPTYLLGHHTLQLGGRLYCSALLLAIKTKKTKVTSDDGDKIQKDSTVNNISKEKISRKGNVVIRIKHLITDDIIIMRVCNKQKKNFRT